jgi:aminoglycoside phosphotransferase (APT) family kinase protein
VQPDLQSLFVDPVLEQVELDPGFEDHGSSVFRVRTATEHVVARSFRADGLDGAFWGSLRALFGIDPLDPAEAVAVTALLSHVSPLAVPRVHRVGVIGGRAWIVVELMDGAPPAGFDELSEDGLRGFGRALATIHRRRFETLGNPSGSRRYAASEFPARLARVVRHAVLAHPEASLPDALFADMCATVAELAPPTCGSLVLPDMFAPQFLARDGRVVALVDVDAYVVGPCELDLVGLEYFLDARTAPLVAGGYGEVAALPVLRDVRRAYRYLLWAITMNPMALDVHRWMAWPAAFE